MTATRLRDARTALEFNRLLDRIARHAHGEPSAALVRATEPAPTANDARSRLSLIGDLMNIIRLNESLGMQAYEDITGYLSALRPRDAVLEAQELLVFLPVLEGIQSASARIQRHPDLASLALYNDTLLPLPHLSRVINRSVGPDGEILDSASLELSTLRQQIRSLERRIGRRLEEMTHDPQVEQFLQDTFITKRSGRWVIPVRMDSKGMVAGVVHDISRTGETAFMEPLEIISLSNELENLTAEARAEEIRILRSISATLREAAPELQASYQAYVTLDAANAIADFASKQRFELPGITETGAELDIRDGSHPLLLLQHREGRGAPVIPLHLRIGGRDGDQNVMVITGPNAGGKTISIKTVGLLCLMAQCGLPVPAAPESRFPFTNAILADIGDEQSVEHHLSTFSAHVARTVEIIKAASPGSLVLLDELGTGTDPSQGAALGCAILSHLMGRGAMVLATTHLVDIVAYVHRTAGMVNASMEFDPDTLKPLYTLRPGEPGQSHAIETARAYGMPEEIIRQARTLAGSMQVELEDLMHELKTTRMSYERQLLELKTQQRELQQQQAALQAQIKEASDKRTGLLAKALEEADRIVLETRRDALSIIEEIKREQRRDSLSRLDSQHAQLKAQLKSLVPQPEGPDLATLSPGDPVHIPSLKLHGEVLSIDATHNRLRVKTSGGKELELPSSSIVPAKAAPQPSRVSIHLTERSETASNEIKLIGMRVDEALDLLEPFLNSASLSHLTEVRIIHGIGTGALKKGVREFLKGHPLVETYKDAEQFEGAGGATIVTLR